MTNPYYSVNDYLKQQYGQKVYRLSLNGGMTCPNRDGTCGTRGCIFCSEGGSGDFAESPSLSVTEQIEAARKRISNKTNATKFIAYFQAYTNTYAPVEYLRAIFTEAIMHPDIVILSIATRSDCLPPPVIELLSELNQIKPVWVELGLQSIHAKTLEWIRSGQTLAMFEDAFYRLYKQEIPVIVHLILGFPTENRDMMLESVNYLSTLPIFGVKLQLLHILQGTDLAAEYEQTHFKLPTLTEYIDLICDCLRILPPSVTIHRLTGDGPKRLLIAPQWSADKKRVLNTLHHTLKEKQIVQGKGDVIWQNQIPSTK